MLNTVLMHKAEPIRRKNRLNISQKQVLARLTGMEIKTRHTNAII